MLLGPRNGTRHRSALQIHQRLEVWRGRGLLEAAAQRSDQASTASAPAELNGYIRLVEASPEHMLGSLPQEHFDLELT